MLSWIKDLLPGEDTNSHSLFARERVRERVRKRGKKRTHRRGTCKHHRWIPHHWDPQLQQIFSGRWWFVARKRWKFAGERRHHLNLWHVWQPESRFCAEIFCDYPKILPWFRSLIGKMELWKFHQKITTLPHFKPPRTPNSLQAVVEEGNVYNIRWASFENQPAIVSKRSAPGIKMPRSPIRFRDNFVTGRKFRRRPGPTDTSGWILATCRIPDRGMNNGRRYWCRGCLGCSNKFKCCSKAVVVKGRNLWASMEYQYKIWTCK